MKNLVSMEDYTRCPGERFGWLVSRSLTLSSSDILTKFQINEGCGEVVVVGSDDARGRSSAWGGAVIRELGEG